MTAYDSIERGAADECEPLRGRRSRTFTLTHLLVACGAVCVCAIAATTVVNTHLANFDDDSALANFVDDSALADFVDDSALADINLGSALDDDSASANFDLGANLGHPVRRSRSRSSYPGRRLTTCEKKALKQFISDRRKAYGDYKTNKGKCPKSGSRKRGRRLTTCEKKALKQYISDRRKVYANYKTNKGKCPKPYDKTAGKALKGNGASGACSDRLTYGFAGLAACEEKCNQCDDCKGFVDNRDASPPYCVFKSATNVYDNASKDWYAKPN